MTPVKTTDVDYIHFLIAEFCAFSCCEAKRCSKYSSASPYHDSFHRLPDTYPSQQLRLCGRMSHLLSLTIEVL